jgi:hypothetical protein
MSVAKVNELLDRIETVESRLKDPTNSMASAVTEIAEVADILHQTLLTVRTLELGREARQDRESR